MPSNLLIALALAAGLVVVNQKAKPQTPITASSWNRWPATTKGCGCRS